MKFARRDDRLLFVPYLIPGAPSDETYRECMGILEQLGVSLYEITVPVRSGWSNHANTIIQEYHATSSWSLDTTLTWVQSYRPNLFVLYQDLLKVRTFPELLDCMAGKVDSLILEWDEPDFRPYQKACESRGIEFVHSIHPKMDEGEMRDLVAEVTPGGIVYLLSSDRTGGDLFPVDELARTTRVAKRYRCDITVLAGFGIHSPAQVRELRKIRELDGVIVGTALLEASKRGPKAFRSLASELIRAC